MAVNCGAIPETLIESELFGHAKGAFTDARSAKRGLFEEADGGTLLLDEVGELPLPVQPKLLRVLQEGEVRRVGDNRSTRVDVRVLAATNRDLAAQVQQGRFREDLYLPAQRGAACGCRRCASGRRTSRSWRRGCSARHGERLGLPQRRLSPRALESLRRYRWPGNVRELENALERALVLSEEEEIAPESLPEAVQRALDPEPLPPAARSRRPLGEARAARAGGGPDPPRARAGPAATAPAPPSCSSSRRARCSTRSASTAWNSRCHRTHARARHPRAGGLPTRAWG